MGKRHGLKRELTGFMLLASIVTLIFVGLAVIYSFYTFFVPNAKKDIEYLLTSKTQQYQSYMQFIEDGAISIRHNDSLSEFFENSESDLTGAKKQLAYSMELFTDRNRVNRQVPFVTSVYLFNQYKQCVHEQYYAITLSEEAEQESRYRTMQSWFQGEEKQYACIQEGRNINVIFHVYDDKMNERGIGIAQVSLDAVDAIFYDLKTYQNHSWFIIGPDNRILASDGQLQEDQILKKQSALKSENEIFMEDRSIVSLGARSFGLKSIISVGQSNVLTILRPTLMIFGAGFALVMLLTVLVSLGLSTRLTRPVTKMIQSIRHFGKQNFDVRMEDSSIQEFHDIGSVFNEMADRIQYLITQVYEKQLAAKTSQVKYLQAQLNPHFQFNILAMLSLKAKMAGNDSLYESLNAFSRLIQGKIFRKKEIRINVKEELEIVRFYLLLQKERYQDKLEYEISLDDDEINTCLIPRLLIEPLVENAVSHGLEPKKEKGMIRVHLYERETDEEGKRLCIAVEDNGVGIDFAGENNENPASNINEGESEHTHTGLENTRRVLQILYGEEYRFKIQSQKGIGTKVKIILPIERSQDLCGES